MFDGGRIARHQKNGSSMAAFLNQEPRRPLRDHQKANVIAMRKKQQKVRDDKMREELQDDRTNWKMGQFSNISSRVYLQNKENGVNTRANFLKKNTGQSVAHQSDRNELVQKRTETPPTMYATEETAPPKAGIPTRSEIQERMAAKEVKDAQRRNFVSENRMAARENLGVGIDDFMKAADKLKELHGQKQIKKDEATGIPNYLTKIKTGLEDQRRRELEEIAAKNTVIPEGHRLLSEEERVDTLTALEAKQAELETAFRKLPLKIETEGQKVRQREIQTKFKEIENAIKMFQKPTVIVKLDA